MKKAKSAAEIVAEPNFNPGGIVDRVDLRDFKVEEVATATPPYDWSTEFDIEKKLKDKITVKDQGASGSCGGQAWSYLAEVLEALASGSLEERSAKYVYAQTYQQGGGSTGRDNANIFVRQGVSLESLCPSYMGSNLPSEAFMELGGDISLEARANATLAQSTIYAQDGTTIDAVAKSIRDFNGVILGVSGQNNGTWTTPFPRPPAATQWRHWLYAGKVKKFNGVKHIGFLNSWGKDVGENGWQWLSEAYFKNIAFGDPSIWSAWTHVFHVNQPIPPSTFHHTFNVDLEYHGRRGAEVVALQNAMKIEGFFPKTVASTGFFGLITLGAVMKYQSLMGIFANGRVGSVTRAALNAKYA